MKTLSRGNRVALAAPIAIPLTFAFASVLYADVVRMVDVRCEGRYECPW